MRKTLIHCICLFLCFSLSFDTAWSTACQVSSLDFSHRSIDSSFTTEALSAAAGESIAPYHPIVSESIDQGAAARLNALVRDDDQLTATEYQAHVLDTMRSLRDGGMGTVVYGLNAKKFNEDIAKSDTKLDMAEVYKRANRRLTQKYGGHIKAVPSWERRTERPHDMPGLMGILEQVIGQKGTEWRDQSVVIVPDGGKKTRFATKILSEGYSGLTRLFGGLYENIREFAFINALATLRYLPDGFQRFVAVVGSDQMRKLGKGAGIGGISLKDKNRLAERLKDASVINGGARIELLTPQEITLLDKISYLHEWTEEMVGGVLKNIPALSHGKDGKPEFPNRWEELKKIIDREKLTQLGMLSGSRDGLMTGFMEKEENLGMLIRLFYETTKKNEYLYKNPFDFNLDKRFAERVLKALKNRQSKTLSTTQSLKTLDQLGVSFMQTAFQSHFVNSEQWMKIRIDTKQTKIEEADWRALKEVIDEVWTQEAADGFGKIYVLDYGADYRWMDVADLREWNAFLNTAVADDDVRASLGLKPGIEIDQETVHLDGQLEIKGDAEPGTLYIERVSVTGGGTLIVVRGNTHDKANSNGDRTLISNVHFHVPQGQILIVDAGAKILDSDIDQRTTTRVNIAPGSLVERVFSISQEGLALVPELWARPDERVTVLQVLDDGGMVRKTGLVRSLISYPFTKKALKSFDPVVWERLRARNPEYLGNIGWGDVASDFYGNPDPALGGYSTADAQPHASYVWQDNMVRALDTRIDKSVGVSRDDMFNKVFVSPGIPGAEAVVGKHFMRWGPVAAFMAMVFIEGLRAFVGAQYWHSSLWGATGVGVLTILLPIVLHLFGVFVQDANGEWKSIGIQDVLAGRVKAEAFFSAYQAALPIASTSIFGAFLPTIFGMHWGFALVTALLPHAYAQRKIFYPSRTDERSVSWYGGAA